MTARASTYSPWAAPTDLPFAEGEVTEAVAGDALQMASDVLFQFTGRQWPGLGTETFRPSCGHHVGGCGCSWHPELVLPWSPIAEVVSVTIDGVELPEGGYQLVNGSLLVRTRATADDPRLGWPAWQDLTLPTTQPNTFEVVVQVGAEPPVGGKRSAITLASELARAWTPTLRDSCSLPRRVTNIARQGISMAVLDPLTLFEERRTGINTVDLWVGSVNAGERGRGGAIRDVAGRGNRRRGRRWRQVTEPPAEG